MDRPIEKQNIRRRKILKGLRTAGLIGLVIVGIWAFRNWIKPKAEADKLRTARVEQGSVSASITANGLVVPAFEEQLNAPIGSTIEKITLRTGAVVEAGALILELDEEFVGLQLEGLRDQLAVRQNSIALLELEFDRDIQELAYDTEILSLRLAAAEAQLSDSRRLLEIGGATQEDVEAAELNVQITRLERDKLQNELTYRRASLDGRTRQLELEVGIQEKEVRELSRKMNDLAVSAPRPGVITWINESVGQQVDAGTPLVRIADLSAFRLEGTCSDRYAEQVKLGYKVEVRIGNDRLSGTVSSILPEVENNTLRFIVELDNEGHQALRPNLRTELRVISGQRDQVVRVKNGPAFRGGNTQDIFVVEGNQAIRRKIRMGLRNSDFIEITEGLQAGETIIISDLEPYRDLERFTISE